MNRDPRRALIGAVSRPALLALFMEVLLVAQAFLFSTRLQRPATCLVAAGAFLASAILRRGGGFPIPLLLFFTPLLLGFPLSLSWGSAPGPSWEVFGVILAGAALAAVGLRLRVVLEEPKAFFREGSLFASAAILLAVGAVAETIVHRRIPLLWFISPIDLSLAILLLGAAGLHAVPEGRKRNAYLLAVAVGALVGTSRAVWLALFVVFILQFGRLGRLLRVVALVGLLAALPWIVSRLEKDPLAWNRTRIYAGAMNLVLERPWTGWGYGSFDSISRRSLLPDPLPVRRMRIPVYAHCDPLELAIELGIPLTCAFFAGALLLIPAIRRDEVLSSLWAALCIVSLFYFPMRLVFPFFLILFETGRRGNFSAREAGGSERKSIRFVGAGVGLLFLLYGFGLLTGRPSLAPFDARLLIENGTGEERIFRALELDPERPEHHFNLAIFSGRHGSTSGAIRHAGDAMARAPRECRWSFELSRLWFFAAAEARRKGDTMALEAALSTARRNLTTAGVLEPLLLAPYRERGDTAGLILASQALERLQREGEPAGHIAVLRRFLGSIGRDGAKKLE